jgi:hypothetical protein
LSVSHSTGRGNEFSRFQHDAARRLAAPADGGTDFLNTHLGELGPEQLETPVLPELAGT